MPTALIYAPEFLDHDTGSHPENAGRVSGIKTELEKLPGLNWLAPREAEEADILRCHTDNHLDAVYQAWGITSTRKFVALDPDTMMSRGSLKAALLGSGGVVTAVDAVMSGQVENAFVLVRPPGHHATPDQAMGFCIFNHVAVGARYVQETYNLERVLIVDWDVHHGNGTQDIFYADKSVFYYSLHQFPHYPGTGSHHETGVGAGKGYTLNIPLPAYTSAADHVREFRRGLKEITAKIKPDFILVSAGFDAHIADPLGELQLTDQDFSQMTTDLKHLAAEYCEGRLVSMLEGGYNLTTLPYTVSRHVRALQAKE
ncbi:MAG: histone deacetylase [Blastocatellia bacterium]|nr:histone deacetylase [Blastocatellia bacterium]